MAKMVKSLVKASRVCLVGVLALSMVILSGCGCGCNCMSCTKNESHAQATATHKKDCSCCCCSGHCSHKKQEGQDQVKRIAELKKEVIKEGPADAAKVAPGQKIVVHYTGWLSNDGEPGQKFDSSLDRGQPLAFQIGVGRVIKGWEEGLIEMKVGEKCRLFIPSHMAYGPKGAGGVIPPDADLIFDVELLEIA